VKAGSRLAHDEIVSPLGKGGVRPKLSVSTFPPSEDAFRTRVSNGGGVHPVWSRDSNQLYYQVTEQHGGPIMVVDYAIEGDELIPGRPRVWVEDRLVQFWDMAPDGRALVTVLDDPDSVADDHHIVFMQNFLDEVRRRVPSP